MEIILLLIYLYMGYKAIMYLRVALLNQTAIFYSNTGAFYFTQFTYAFFCGWIMIPLALLIRLLSGKTSN